MKKEKLIPEVTGNLNMKMNYHGSALNKSKRKSIGTDDGAEKR